MNPSAPATDNSGTPTDDSTKLPHDRDETAKPGSGGPQHDANRAVGEQARSDVESPTQDTERIGIPSDVPSSKENRK